MVLILFANVPSDLSLLAFGIPPAPRSGISRRYAENPEGTGIRSTGSFGLLFIRTTAMSKEINLLHVGFTVWR
jgi:hypothetical protein